MVRHVRALALLSGLACLVLTTTLLGFLLQKMASLHVVLQTEQQHDMTNVKFSVPPPNRLQLANMRYHNLDTTKVATMTELRSNPQLVPHLLHMMNVLDDDWPFRIYHSNENAFLFRARQFERHLKSGKLTLVPLNIDLSSHDAVSDYMAHRAFWDNLAPARHVLIFQTDSILCSRSDARVEDFFAYDYVGAPVHERFHDDLEDRFMNGGFSLRNRETMLKVIESFLPFSDPDNDIFTFEDQFFVRRIREIGGKIPTREVAMQFSVESVYHPNPLAVHQAERYLDQPDEVEHIRALKNDWCPEMHLLYGRVGPKAFVCDVTSEHYDQTACADAGANSAVESGGAEKSEESNAAEGLEKSGDPDE